MSVHLWYDTTTYLITAVVATVFFFVAMVLLVRSWRFARGAELIGPTLTAATIAMVVYLYPAIPTAADLQDVLDRAYDQAGRPWLPLDAPSWVTAVHNVSELTAYSAWLTFLRTGFEILTILAVAIAVFGVYLRLTTAADAVDGMTPAQRWRRNWRINRHQDRITTAIITFLKTHGITSGEMRRHRDRDTSGTVITRFLLPPDLTPELIETVAQHIEADPAVQSAAADDRPLLHGWLTVTWDLETIDTMRATPLSWPTLAYRNSTVIAGVGLILLGATGLFALAAHPPQTARPQDPTRDVASPTRPVDTVINPSQPAAEPDVAIPLPLTHEPCSATANCAVLDGSRFIITLSDTATITSVSLVPDELLPGRIVTQARWDFYNPNQTPQTAQLLASYSASRDPGWSVNYPLARPFRASKLALTVLDSVPLDPHAGPPPGPGIASVISLTAHPQTARHPGETDSDGVTAAPPQRSLR